MPALGEALHVSYQQVYKYESGANSMSFERLQQIARALQCTVEDLTGEATGPQADAPAEPGENQRVALEVSRLIRQMEPAKAQALHAVARAMVGGA